MIFRKKPIDDILTFNHRHLGDVVRIQRVAEQNGYEADLEACAYLWDEYSDRYAAGWLGLPEDDNDLWTLVLYEAGLRRHIKGFDI